MYTSVNFKTKKAFKEAVAKFNEEMAAHVKAPGSETPRGITIYQPNNMFNTPDPVEGRHTVEGPHYPAAHTWYAGVTLKDGCVVQVR